jgi:hypothetical protein
MKRWDVLRDIEVTLYDIFGYLLPGCVSLVALFIIIRTIVFPDKALPYSQPTTFAVTVFLILAYYAGHIVHAIADQLEEITGYDYFTELEDEVEEEMERVVDEGWMSK